MPCLLRRLLPLLLPFPQPRLSPWLRALAFAMLALSCVVPRIAFAQTCSFTVSNLAFGNMSTITGTPVDAIGTVGVSCTGFSTATIRLCLSLGAPTGGLTPRTLNGPSGATLAYGIYTDAAHTTIWGSRTSSTYGPNIIDLAVVSGGASTTVPMYGRINAGQSTAPYGSYTQSFAPVDVLFWWGGYTGTPPGCSGYTPAQSPTFSVSANVVADCNITAAPLVFPAVTALASAVSAVSSVSVTCVSGAPYTVALDGGTTPGASVSNRLMRLAGGSATVSYGLYKDPAWTQIWGNGSGGTTTNAGTGTGGTQTFTVYGRAPPQAVPPPGNYSDTITATVSF